MGELPLIDDDEPAPPGAAVAILSRVSAKLAGTTAPTSIAVLIHHCSLASSSGPPVMEVLLPVPPDPPGHQPYEQDHLEVPVTTTSTTN